MNRIKELRTSKKLTLKELSEELKKDNVNISADSLAKYEREERKPKIENWNKLAYFFEVPTSYLMGLSDDVNGWEEWAKNTGYSIEQIKAEIKRLKETNRLSDSVDIQYQIGQAVKSLDDDSYSTTQGVQHELVFQLTSLISKVNDAFLEPPKGKDKAHFIYSFKVRDDMDKDAYKKIIDALTEAKYKIGQIPINTKYLH